ncbi:MAG: DUF2076 family protein [Terracidiphilus sp.]
MTPQEEQLLNSLVERVNQTQLQEKDPDAEALLNQGLGSNPDALYVMAQTVLVQNIALDQARAQVAQLQQQLQQAQQQAQQARQQPVHATSFLGNLLGHRDPAPPPPQPPPVQPSYLPPQQAYVPPPPPPAYAAPQYQQPQFVPAGQPSFLRGAMQTAAGVAAGALAFEGVESVLHGIGGFGHEGYGFGGSGLGMGGMGMGGGMMGRPMEETVINNYYDQAGGHEHAEHGGFDQGGQDSHLHESDEKGSQFGDQGGAQLSDASYSTSGDDREAFDNTNMDDQVLDGNLTQDDGGSGFDDGGGFDNGGSSDDGGGGVF